MVTIIPEVTQHELSRAEKHVLGGVDKGYKLWYTWGKEEGVDERSWMVWDPTEGRYLLWSTFMLRVGERSVKNQKGQNQTSSARGFAVDKSWYHSTPEEGSQAERNRINAVRVVDEVLEALGGLKSELSVVRSLLYVVQVTSSVLADVQLLVRALEEVMADTSSTRDLLSGRARANERREARHRSTSRSN